MKAINDVRRYLKDHADSPAADVLARLASSLSREDSLSLHDLYTLDWESFELAIELMRDWRIDRYYADRLQPLTAAGSQASPSDDALEPAE